MTALVEVGAEVSTVEGAELGKLAFVVPVGVDELGLEPKLR